jgi:hypothetical protein
LFSQGWREDRRLTSLPDFDQVTAFTLPVARGWHLRDEPTTGLHISDIAHPLAIVDRLVDSGNTVIVIEHNLGVVCGESLPVRRRSLVAAPQP